MSAASLFQLILLAAIWGSSFLFMRVAVEPLGPVVLITGRVGFAAVFLLLTALMLRRAMQMKRHGLFYAVIGFFNSALPFVLFAYAAQTLSASLLSILNATAPIWGAIVAAIWHKQAPKKSVLMGLLLGVIGVGILVGFDPEVLNQLEHALLAVFAATAAAFCYGIASVYAQNADNKPDAFNTSHGSMWLATSMLLPFCWLFPVSEAPTLEVTSMVVLLGVVCSGVAYLLYFKLVNDIGAPSALTVTFLIPVFGVLWGHVYLDEAIGLHTLVGASIVLVGTALVTGFSPKRLFAIRAVT